MLTMVSDFISPAEASRLSGGLISTNALRRWAQDGRIVGAFITLSGRVLLPPNVVDQLVRPI
jgi:hypothetical protein